LRKDKIIVEDHDSTIFWDQVARRWTNLSWDGFNWTPSATDEAINLGNSATTSHAIMPTATNTKQCPGFTLKSIEGIKRIKEDRRADLVLGFKHTCRESFTTRTRLSQPTEDKWKYRSPVVGALTNLNTDDEVRWLVEEAPHPSRNQFDHISIYALECTKAELNPDEEVCGCCTKRRKALLARIQSSLTHREGPFHPSTRKNILARSGSLQKKHGDYHQK
jgi:hypothetical protein